MSFRRIDRGKTQKQAGPGSVPRPPVVRSPNKHIAARAGRDGTPELRCEFCKEWLPVARWWVHDCKGSPVKP